jgi:hypothetical protein
MEISCIGPGKREKTWLKIRLSHLLSAFCKAKAGRQKELLPAFIINLIYSKYEPFFAHKGDFCAIFFQNHHFQQLASSCLKSIPA